MDNTAERPEYREVDSTTGTRGAVAELRVAADLLQRGLQVFRALSPSCPTDLAAGYPGKRLFRVEVKTAYVNHGRIYIPESAIARNDFDVLALATRDRIYYISRDQARLDRFLVVKGRA